MDREDVGKMKDIWGAFDNASAPAEKVEGGRYKKLAEIVLDLRKKVKELEDELKATKRQFKMAREDFRNVLIEDGSEKAILLGHSFAPMVDIHPHVPMEAKEDFFAWLRDNDFGDLIKEDVHYQTLKAWVKERRAMHDAWETAGRQGTEPILPPGEVDIFEQPDLQIRKQPK